MYGLDFEGSREAALETPREGSLEPLLPREGELGPLKGGETSSGGRGLGGRAFGVGGDGFGAAFSPEEEEEEDVSPAKEMWIEAADWRVAPAASPSPPPQGTPTQTPSPPPPPPPTRPPAHGRPEGASGGVPKGPSRHGKGPFSEGKGPLVAVDGQREARGGQRRSWPRDHSSEEAQSVATLRLQTSTLLEGSGQEAQSVAAGSGRGASDPERGPAMVEIAGGSRLDHEVGRDSEGGTTPGPAIFITLTPRVE